MSQIRRRMAETMNYEQCTTNYEHRPPHKPPILPISPGPPSHLYICREPSTNQLLFMQNKPNFQESQMNANVFITKDYENKSDWTIGQNKPNSNPIKPNLPKG